MRSGKKEIDDQPGQDHEPGLGKEDERNKHSHGREEPIVTEVTVKEDENEPAFTTKQKSISPDAG